MARMGRKRARAAVVLFLDGFSFQSVARLLRLTCDDVVRAVRVYSRRGR